jgi:bacteriocin-like protein
MAAKRKPKSKTKIKIEKLPKDEQLNEEELKKVTGGVTPSKPLTIDCWQK